jgi:hypothetical protein
LFLGNSKDPLHRKATKKDLICPQRIKEQKIHPSKNLVHFEIWASQKNKFGQTNQKLKEKHQRLKWWKLENGIY